MQTNLEKEAIEQRGVLEINNDYQKGTNEYNIGHSDTISNGDPQGKGVNMSGHGFSLPDHNLVGTGISRKNFNTESGGGKYDIEGFNGHDGRKVQTMHNLYNEENQYPGNIDMSGNVGQYNV